MVEWIIKVHKDELVLQPWQKQSTKQHKNEKKQKNGRRGGGRRLPRLNWLTQNQTEPKIDCDTQKFQDNNKQHHWLASNDQEVKEWIEKK